MIVYMTWFSKRGEQLAERISKLQLGLTYRYTDKLGGRLADTQLIVRDRKGMSLSSWAEEAFHRRAPVIFIGAVGIAVRTIAPYIKSKTIDSPVLVVDEAGSYVIPVLSGHFGGANELAAQLAGQLSAQAVITTATDVNGAFAVDVYARENGLRVMNPSRIKDISGRVLDGSMADSGVLDGSSIDESATDGSMTDGSVLMMDDVVVADSYTGDALHLKPKRLVLGMGCRRGKSFEDIWHIIEKAAAQGMFDLEDICAVASVDVKESEPGIIELAQVLRVPYIVYSAEELAAVEGDFGSSEFVKQTVGVDNVCERAAAASGGQLIVHKQAADGVTFAVAQVERT